MEANSGPSSKHLAAEKKDQPTRKKIKIDRSGLGDLALPSTVSNGVKSAEIKTSKHHEKLLDGSNDVFSLKKEADSHNKAPLKRPANDSDDDTPLGARSKLKLSVSSHSDKTISTVKESSNDVKKIKKKIKSETNGSPKVEKPKNLESNESVKKMKPESSSKSDSIKKVKHDSGSSKTPALISSGADGVKQSKSESSSKIEGIKKIKSESSLKSSSKTHGTAKTNDPTKKIKHDLEASVKIKSENGLKTPHVKRKDTPNKDESFSKTDKNKSSSKDSGSKQMKHSSELTSPTIDKKAKHSSSKVEGVKKIKSESSSGTSSSPEKKHKSNSDSSKSGVSVEKKMISETSPKVEGIKKIATESSSALKHTTTKTDDSEDDVPLAARAKVKSELETKKKTPSNKERKRKMSDGDEDDDDYKPLKKRKSEAKAAVKKESTKKGTPKVKKEKESGKTAEKAKGKDGGKGKEKKEEEVWKWWEEEKHPEGIKWLTLEHKGPYFPPEYEPLPDSVNFYYNGEKVDLCPKSEEVAGFYAKMLDHDYTSKKIFNDNFFEDWRKEMNDEERALIKNLSKCDFKEIHAYYTKKNEERKAMSKEEKLKIKEKNEEILQEYGYCMMDGHKERVGNFKIEPPGLFRGRGDHPKQGKLKKRLKARDVIINIGKDAKVPDPPVGQRWKAVSHDNKVTWLACWIENIQGSYKYVMLNPTSRIKGEKDWQKYETARKLKDHIGKIRSDYTNDWKSKEMRIRQRGVALYFIDKLALRAGHEKDEDTADTVGCCSLRCEHIKLHRFLNEKEFVVEFDFLGKDSIHYHNLVEVEKRVFKNLELFQQGKSGGDDLFDRLSTASLNKYLSELMDGLSAKVFRTFNASMTLQDQLNKLEVENNVAANVLGYNRANRAVAILCNHQRTAPKTFEQSMSNLQQKIDDKRKAIKNAKNELKDLKHEAKGGESVTLTRKIEKKKTAIEKLKEQLFKLEVSQTDKNENKEIALGTSKLNYLDPRISIAWCLNNNVPIEKIYNKTQRQKFAWAIDMTEKDFVF